MSEGNELQLRKAIWKELKRFLDVGTTIAFLETKPEIFYDSQELSLTLEKILVLIKKYPLSDLMIHVNYDKHKTSLHKLNGEVEKY